MNIEQIKRWTSNIERPTSNVEWNTKTRTGVSV